MGARRTIRCGTGGRAILRRILPWLLALGLLAFLLSRVSLDQLGRALGQGPVTLLAGFVLLQVAALLVADGFATHAALRALGVEAPRAEVTLARGATYLAGLVSYAAGQGAMSFYLHRVGVRGARLVASLAFLLGTNAVVLVALGGGGLIASGAVDPVAWRLGAALAVALSGLYLAILVRPPAFFARRELLKPLLEAGVRGHAAALAARLPHVAVLAVGQWAAMRLWGIPVPAAAGLALVAIVLLVAALPLAPAGIGTSQAAQVLLFSSYAPFADDAERRAFVLGFALIYQVAGISGQLFAGTLCLVRLRRRWPAARGDGQLETAPAAETEVSSAS